VVAGSALVKLGLRTLSQYRSVAGRAEPDRVRILSLLDGSSISEAPGLVHFPNEHGASLVERVTKIGERSFMPLAQGSFSPHQSLERVNSGLNLRVVQHSVQDLAKVTSLSTTRLRARFRLTLKLWESGSFDV
jgi:hypothetical protein